MAETLVFEPAGPPAPQGKETAEGAELGVAEAGDVTGGTGLFNPAWPPPPAFGGRGGGGGTSLA